MVLYSLITFSLQKSYMQPHLWPAPHPVHLLSPLKHKHKANGWINDSSGNAALQEKGGLRLSGNKGQREELSKELNHSTASLSICDTICERVWKSVMAACQVEALGISSRAQTVTCASGQIQTTMTKSGSDIIPYGLASSSDGIIKAMALDLMV